MIESNKYRIKLSEEKMKKILITSIAGMSGLYVSKILLKYVDLEIFGIDVVDDLIGLQKSVKYSKAPRIDSQLFNDFIQNLILENQFDVIIPVASHDVEFFSKNYKDFEGKSRLLISDYENHSIFTDKQKTYKKLKKAGLRTPEVFDGSCRFDFPLIWKPFNSTGSKGIQLVSNLIDFNYLKDRKDGFFNEYIDGEEFTCDCFFDLNGKCKGFLVRKREEVRSGAAVRTSNVNLDLREIIKKIEGMGLFKGPLNFQFKIKNGEYVIFDVNDRLASGGTPLSVNLGFNIPRMIIDELEESANDFAFEVRKQVTMIRYYEEYFIEK
jgi:carbamoyl-phosphate synthase large subunit